MMLAHELHKVPVRAQHDEHLELVIEKHGVPSASLLGQCNTVQCSSSCDVRSAVVMFAKSQIVYKLFIKSL